jgi:hypothetical protein
MVGLERLRPAAPGITEETNHESFTELLEQDTKDCINPGHFYWNSETNTVSDPLWAKNVRCATDMMFKIGEPGIVVCQDHASWLFFLPWPR